MKRKISLIFLTFALLLASCGKKSQDYLNAVVTEVTETGFLVECIDETSGETTGAPLFVPGDTVSAAQLPDISVGDTIRVVYNGVEEKEFPPELETVFAIYLMDETGNVLPN